jgi:hypothetical protein
MAAVWRHPGPDSLAETEINMEKRNAVIAIDIPTIM